MNLNPGWHEVFFDKEAVQRPVQLHVADDGSHFDGHWCANEFCRYPRIPFEHCHLIRRIAEIRSIPQYEQRQRGLP